MTVNDIDDSDDQTGSVQNNVLSASDLRARAHDFLNVYLEKRLDSLHLPDEAEIKRQQESFIEAFGPDRLSTMSGLQLLEAIPHNVTNPQPMDYWLEFKNDETFDSRLFGSILGGSAAKFGTWQDKKTSRWKAKRKGTNAISEIAEDEALEIVRSRRDEAIASLKALEGFRGRPVQELDPEEVQQSVERAAPRWNAHAWLHKYLHLNVPELVTWSATISYLRAELNRLGVLPEGSGLYALDICLYQVWASLSALSSLPVHPRSRIVRGLDPRRHWRFIMRPNEPNWREMIEDGFVGFGPKTIGDLTEAFSLSTVKEIRDAVETVLVAVGVNPTMRFMRSIGNLGIKADEGIVALMTDPMTVVAVGEITGGYEFVADAERPHRVPVRWLHRRAFRISAPPNRSRGLYVTKPERPMVSEVEASLIVAGHFVWPDFAQVVGAEVDSEAGPTHIESSRTSTVPTVVLPPPDPVVGKILSMLRRKSQAILYGPPGTGKTYHAKRAALELVARKDFSTTTARLSESQKAAIWGRDGAAPRIWLCTFHPAYSYEDFIEGYRPAGESFTLQDGIFLKAVDAARANPRWTFVLIIDEINRGNIPKIFGELITLVEHSRRGKDWVVLPMSGMPRHNGTTRGCAAVSTT